jgi:hypothetical protein
MCGGMWKGRKVCERERRKTPRKKETPREGRGKKERQRKAGNRENEKEVVREENR